MTFGRILIANRGEIAVRVIRACRALHIETVVVVSEADKGSLPARLADKSVCIGPAPAAASYLNTDAIIGTALAHRVDAVHPGYGFLSENAAFANACQSHGIRFIGPDPAAISTMGNKHRAREAAQRAGVAVVPGSPVVSTTEALVQAARDVGYPLLFKAAAGGGGRGMRSIASEHDLVASFELATREAQASFGDGSIYLERYLPHVRHIEVQVVADGFGNILHLGCRDCSVQRNFQKVIEEAPAPFLPATTAAAITRDAVELATAIGYDSVGTVEFLYDPSCDEHYFLEMNTRLQVEHPVTEAITGIDLVQRQIAIAQGDRLELDQQDVTYDGHAIECRVTAESPDAGFRPSPGRITAWRPPSGPGLRLDTHAGEDYLVPPHYDSLLGKLVAHGADREAAVERMLQALSRFEIAGIDTNLGLLGSVVDDADFRAGKVHTGWLEAVHMISRNGTTSVRPDAGRAD